MQAKSLVGLVCNELTVVARVDNRGRKVAWQCDCAHCGEQHVAIGQHLTAGRAKCPRRRSISGLPEDLAVVDDATAEQRRGREWQIWRLCLARIFSVHTADYPAYGGAGVQFAERWLTFSRFIADVGPCPSDKHCLARLARDYAPGQVAWLTRKELTRLRKACKTVEYKGETRYLADLADEYGIRVNTLAARVFAFNWPIEEALSVKPIWGNRSVPVDYEGVHYSSYADFARAFGLHHDLVYDRLALGWTLQQIAETPPGDVATAYEYDGVTWPSKSACARHYDVPPELFASRLSRGQSPDQALRRSAE